MNGTNALVFAVFGFLMEALPVACPSWFPPSGADGTSARALWLETMGAVQLGTGALHGVRMLLESMAARVPSAAHGEALALTGSTGVSTH